MRTNLAGTATVALTAAGLVCATATAGAGIVLAGLYRPHAPASFGLDASPEAQRSDQWSDLHLWAGLGLLASTSIVLVLLTWSALRGRTSSRPVLALIASVVAAMSAGVALLTRSLVEWDQIALAAVTVGSDVTGYWAAAFGSGVVFVLFGGTEVSQESYAVALLVHLAAPVVSGIALVVLSLMLLRIPRAAAAPATSLQPRHGIRRPPRSTDGRTNRHTRRPGTRRPPRSTDARTPGGSR